LEQLKKNVLRVSTEKMHLLDEEKKHSTKKNVAQTRRRADFDGVVGFATTKTALLGTGDHEQRQLQCKQRRFIVLSSRSERKFSFFQNRRRDNRREFAREMEARRSTRTDDDGREDGAVLFDRKEENIDDGR
jgi:hypothetical protein